jgi:hypothetical protein
VGDSCWRVPGHVLPRQKPGRGEGEDSVKNWVCLERGGSSHRLLLDVAGRMELPSKAGAKSVGQASLKEDDMVRRRDSLIESLDLTFPH